MNKTLWKLDKIGERLWNLAIHLSTIAASIEGKGLAIVAEETRKMSHKIGDVVEKSMLEDEDIDKDEIMELALQLNLLVINTVIEAGHIGRSGGNQVSVCAEEIRGLTGSIVYLFGSKSSERSVQTVTPRAANPMSTISEGCRFLLLNIGGIQFVETLENIKEVDGNMFERKENSIILRSMELPLIDGYKMLGKTAEDYYYVIVQTPWAEQNKLYAVAAHVTEIFYSPIGKPVEPPADMPFAQYVRECWENEIGEPFYFMDWTKMVQHNNL